MKIAPLLIGILLYSTTIQAQAYKQVIITNQVGNESLHFHNNELYAGSERYILRYDLQSLSSPADTLYNNPNPLFVKGMAWHNDYLYFVEGNGDSLKRIKLNPLGSVENVAGTIYNARDMKIVGDTLYIIEVSSTPNLIKYNLSQGSMTRSSIYSFPIDCRTFTIYNNEAYIASHYNNIWKLNDITASSFAATNTNITNLKVRSIAALGNRIYFRHGAVTEYVDLTTSPPYTNTQFANFYAHYMVAHDNVLYGCNQFEIFKFMFATNVDEHVRKKRIALYPNPTWGTIYMNETVKSISIYNQLGILVQVEQNAKKIDLSALRQGCYLAKILTKEGIHEQHTITLK